MKNDDLEKMDDAALENAIKEARQRIKDAENLQERRRKENEVAAIETAKATLAKAGLTFQDALKRARPSKQKASAPGKRYVNPDNAEQVYTTGRGRPPAWFKALQKQGKLPNPQ